MVLLITFSNLKTKTYHLCSKPFLRKTACKPSTIKSRAPKENIHDFGTFNIVITLDIASRKCKINNRRTPIALVNCRHRVCFPSDSIEIYILVCSKHVKCRVYKITSGCIFCDKILFYVLMGY